MLAYSNVCALNFSHCLEVPMPALNVSCKSSLNMASTEITLRECDLGAALTDDLADCAMARFSEANFSRISNKSGFLMGIIRRVQEDGPDRGSDLDMLHRSVRYRMTELIEEVSLQPSTAPKLCRPSCACCLMLVPCGSGIIIAHVRARNCGYGVSMQAGRHHLYMPVSAQFWS